MREHADQQEVGHGWQAASGFFGSDLPLERLLEKLPAGAYTCDAEGLITYFNPQAAQLWGRVPKLHDPVDRFCGSFKLFLPDGSPLAHDQCWMALALKTGNEYNGHEIVIERPDGQRLTVLAHANPIYDEAGGLLGAVNVLVDITERKQVEDMRQHLVAIIESSDDAIIGKTLEGTITSWNRGAERLYGYTAEDVLGKPVSILIPPDLTDEFPRILERLRRGGHIDHYETQRLCKDGTRLDVSLTISPIRDASGRIIGASKIARNITKRKRAEQALQESEERLRLALDAGEMGTWEVDLSSGEAWIDAQEAAILGLSPETQRLGVKAFLELVHPDDRNKVRRQQVLSSKGQDFRAEFRLLCPDGQVRWVVGQGRTRRDAAGRPYRVVGINYDITERKQAEDAQLTLNTRLEQRVAKRTAALKQAHDALRHEMTERQRMQEAMFQQEKLAALGTLLANVAHELNNPLAVATMQLDNLHDVWGSGAWTEDLELLRQAVERCKSVVQSFLALARQQEPTRQAVALNAVIDDVLVLLEHGLEVDGISVHRHLDEQVPPVWADAHQLHHVVANLITNAHHALREVAPPRDLRLTTTVTGDRSQVQLDITDSGPGMPEAVQRRIFDPFFTTKPQGEGSGLGLPLCRNIVEGHDGTIHLASQPGQGTTVRVTLPIAASTVPSPEASPEPVVPAPTASVSILLIDDERGVQRAMSRLLQRRGYEVTTAANGREGLAALEERSYAVILCDMRMPDLDGPGFYRALEQRHPHLLQRVIFLTGDVLGSEAQAFFAQVDNLRIEKPFKAREVRRVIEQVLESP